MFDAGYEKNGDKVKKKVVDIFCIQIKTHHLYKNI